MIDDPKFIQKRSLTTLGLPSSKTELRSLLEYFFLLLHTQELLWACVKYIIDAQK